MNRLIALSFAALLLALPLGGCTFTAGSTQAVVEKAAEVSLPRQRVATLANVLLATKNGLAAEFNAGRISKVEIIATEAPVKSATAAIDKAGLALEQAEAERALAASTPDKIKKAINMAQAAGYEIHALQQSDIAEADINVVRAVLNKSRGIVPVVSN